MQDTVLPADLRFFTVLHAAGSLSAAARELGLTTGAVSKHLKQMETRAGVPLVNRTTRSMMLTPEGELYLQHAQRILGDIDRLADLLGNANQRLEGLLRVHASLGFGRSRVAPLISRFVSDHPHVSVQLQLADTPPALTDDSFDVCIRFGEPPDTRVVARRLAVHERLLCAAPDYLRRHGTPATPQDLARFNCLAIRQGDEAYGVWRLFARSAPKPTGETVKIRSNLATNDGEIAVRWALEGRGILLRSEWDIRPFLDDGRLVQVLPDWHTANADIYAIYLQRHRMSARIRSFVDFIARELGDL
jgi:DNA-binding transcriptional LysR family regulator